MKRLIVVKRFLQKRCDHDRPAGAVRKCNNPLLLFYAKSMAKQDNYKKERTETALSFHFSDFGMRGYISMVKPSGLFLRFSFSFW